MSRPHRLSLFSQRIDRVAHVAWFLGAVVPLGLLASLGILHGGSIKLNLGAEIVPLIISAAVLSLVSFWALRHMTHLAIERMDSDGKRLTTLLNASTALASAASAEEAASIAATYAARVARARAAFVVARGRDPHGVAWCASAGPEASAVHQAHGEKLGRLAAGVVADGQPTVRVPVACSPEGWTAPTTVVMPFCKSSGLAIAALVVVHEQDDGRFDERQLDGLMTVSGLASVALANVDLRNALSQARTEMLQVIDLHVSASSGPCPEASGRETPCSDSQVIDEDRVPTGVA